MNILQMHKIVLNFNQKLKWWYDVLFYILNIFFHIVRYFFYSLPREHRRIFFHTFLNHDNTNTTSIENRPHFQNVIESPSKISTDTYIAHWMRRHFPHTYVQCPKTWTRIYETKIDKNHHTFAFRQLEYLWEIPVFVGQSAWKRIRDVWDTEASLTRRILDIQSLTYSRLSIIKIKIYKKISHRSYIWSRTRIVYVIRNAYKFSVSVEGLRRFSSKFRGPRFAKRP